MFSNHGGTGSVRRIVGVVVVATGLLAACGGKDTASPGTESPQTTSVTSSSPDTVAAPTTDAPTTTSAPADWASLAREVVAAIPGVTGGELGPSAFARDFFSLPVEVAAPKDARLSGAYLRVETAATGLAARWDIRFSSEQAADAIEAATKQAFSDQRFAEGVRVVSELKSGNYVTLNYPATPDGEKAGWGLLTLTVGPETVGNDPTGRTELIVAVERTVPSFADLGLGDFLTAWEHDMPALAEGVTFSGFSADLTKLQTNGVWLEYSYHAPASAFDELVKHYAQNLSKGDLVLGDSTLPTDFSTLEYYSAGFFPTLAGFAVDVTLERTLSDSAQPTVLRYRVRVEPPAAGATDTTSAAG